MMELKCKFKQENKVTRLDKHHRKLTCRGHIILQQPTRKPVNLTKMYRCFLIRTTRFSLRRRSNCLITPNCRPQRLSRQTSPLKTLLTTIQLSPEARCSANLKSIVVVLQTKLMISSKLWEIYQVIRIKRSIGSSTIYSNIQINMTNLLITLLTLSQFRIRILSIFKIRDLLSN